MLIACWSPKGGSGTTVVASALAMVLSTPSRGVATGGGPVLVADLAGDVPAVLGIADPPGAGLSDWLGAGGEVPDDALGRLEVEVTPRLRLLAQGSSGVPAVDGRGEALAAALAADRRAVVADCGRAAHGATLTVAAAAALSLLVLRPCYLALRRALAAPIRPSGVVLVGEEGRSLGRRDVEAVLGVPVRAEVGCDPAVARAVDAGLLAARVPRSLERSLRSAS